MTDQIIGLLCDVNLRGATVVLATHNQDLLRRYAQRVIELNRGKLVSSLGEEKPWR
jgi:ABC-type ATPase involved in cell division